MIKPCCQNEIKIRTPETQKVEIKFRENLEDIRLLVAKEYCSIIMGGRKFARYPQMGILKASRSLSKRESILFETILRISIQIVWLSLGRKSFHQIELEIHRIFKSKTYNIIEHRLKNKYEANLSPEERFVLLGHCFFQAGKLNACSPLLDETKCCRNIDYRIFGLGIIKLPRRLHYLEHVLISPEIMFPGLNLSVGIIGMPRPRFYAMLKEIKMPLSTASSSSASFRHSVTRIGSRASRTSTTGLRQSTAGGFQQNIFKDMILPEANEIKSLPDHFPSNTYPRTSTNEFQKQKWLNRASLKNK